MINVQSIKSKLILFLSRIPKENLLVFIILISSFILKLYFVFYCTDYKNYLFSDMGAYWGRAKERFNGDIFAYGQWSSWATFFHFYLTFVFKILNCLHLSDYRLEAVLFLNVVYSTASVYFFYLISKHFMKDSTFTMFSTLLYAFTYPIIYLNAYILSENIAIPLLILAVCLVLNCSNNRIMLFLAGMVLAIGIAARPSLSLLIIPFFVYVIYTGVSSRISISKGVFLLIGFFLVIFLVIQENYLISNGKLTALAANGGLVFFIQQCKVHWVSSTYEGYVTEIGPPAYLGNPDLARMESYVDHPIHDQDFFYKLGFDCIKRNPRIWFDNLMSLKAFFLGPLFPGAFSCKWFDPLIKLWMYIILFTTASMPFMCLLIRDKKIKLNKGLFIISIPIFIMFTNYIWGPEHRYSYPSIFALYIIFFTFVSYVKDYLKYAIFYLLLIFLLYLVAVPV